MGILIKIAVSIAILGMLCANVYSNKLITYKVVSTSNKDLKVILEEANKKQKMPSVTYSPPAVVKITGFCNEISIVFIGTKTSSSSTNVSCLGLLPDLEKFIAKVIAESTPASRNKIKTGRDVKVEANGEWVELSEIKTL